MKLSEIQSSVITEFINQADSSVKYLAGFNSYLTEIPKLLKNQKFTVLDLKDDISPFAPFLTFLSKSNVTDQLFDDYCYFPHKKTFKSFFAKGNCDKRYDIFVDDDINFERRSMRQTIVSLLEDVHLENFIVFNAQLLSNDALEILRDLEKSAITGSLVFCFDSYYSDKFSEEIRKFFEEKTNARNFLNITEDSDKGVIDDEENLINKYEGIIEYEDIYNTFHNYRLFLAVDENRKFAEWISSNMHVMDFFPEQLRTLQKEIALAYFYANSMDEAVLYLNNVIDTDRNDEDAAAAFIYLAKLFLRKKNLPQAVRYASQARQIVEHNTQSVWYPLALMVEYLTTSRNDKDSSVKKYKIATDALKKAGYTVNYINTATVIPYKISNDPEWRDFVIEHLEEGYRIAKEIEDIPEIASNCHMRAIMLSNCGEKEKAAVLYRESNRLRTQMGELAPLLKIRNGLSWEALCRGDYAEAYILVNSIMNHLYEVTDYSSIINTIKNCMYALFFSRHFEEAYKILLKIIGFLQDLNIGTVNTNSFMPSVVGMLVYRTFIDLDNGDILHSRINCLNLLKKYDEIDVLEKPLLKFIQAVIFLNDGKFDESKKVFNEGIDIYEALKSGQEHRIVFLDYEYAIVLRNLGYTNESDKYFKKGFELASEQKFSYYIKNGNSINVKDYAKNQEPFEVLNLNLDYLEEKVEKEKLLNQLHNRIYEYQFINKIMTLGADAAKADTYLNHVVQSIVDYTMAEGVFVAEKNENGWRNMAYVSSTTDTPPAASVWEGLNQNSEEISHNELIFNEETGEYFRNLSKFDFIGGIIICPKNGKSFKPEVLDILNIAVSNIQAQLVMIKQQEHLLYVSTTDLLSMLKNRRALQEYIATESEKLQRYTPKRRFGIVESIAFIDLDNFKFYNDSFGHEAGDLFISCFSKLLKTVCRAVDFISRFGGDEFVVVMTDTNCDEGKIMASRLYEGLARANYFIPELEALLGRKLEIPKNRYLGFSMGLCSNLDIAEPSDLSSVMMNADHALYYAKEHGKGIVCVYSEVKKLEN